MNAVFRIILLGSLLLLVAHLALSQQAAEVSLLQVDGADSNYIRKYPLKNMVRMFYGAQANSLVYGTSRETSPNLGGDLYRNINDFVGFGVTYKIIDADVSFSLPGTTYLKEERSNLEQFKVSFRYARHKVSFRGYYTDSRGMVSSSTNDQVLSTPSIQERRTGVEAIYFFNGEKYSYRTALYQNEVQTRSAGSFLIGSDFFYRNLGAAEGMTPAAYNVSARFGDQAGMTYLRAPGVIVMPGYAHTWVNQQGKYFLSTLGSAGAGVAFNNYLGNTGTGQYTNAEYAANLMISAGYNGSRTYCRLFILGYARYAPINPAFLMSTNLTMDLQVGYRFGDF